MGHIYATIKISNMERTKSTEIEALADTGATLTVIPKKVAQELNLGEFTTEIVESGAGEIELKRSSARISIDGKESVQDILISDFIDRVLLGVVTLETLALSLDPLTGKLKEKRLLLYPLALKRSTSGERLSLSLRAEAPSEAKRQRGNPGCPGTGAVSGNNGSANGRNGGGKPSLNVLI